MMIKRLSEKIIFKTKLFTIKDTELQLDGGKKVTYQIMEKADTALLVPLDDQGNILFVKEFYNAINEYQLGLPKGRVEAGLNELETANKELQEEVGFKAGELDMLGVLTIAPGYLTQKTHVFLARDLNVSKLDGDELEELEVAKYPFDKFEKLIDEGKLTEARMIAALFLARRFIKHSK